MSAPDRYCSRLRLCIILLFGVVLGELLASLVVRFSPYWQAARACVRAQP